MDTSDLKLENHLVILNQLSYAGFKRPQIERNLDKTFGKENWQEAHFIDGNVITKQKAYKIYEESYYEFLKSRPDVLEWLVNTASEVYDIQPSNIESGCDYNKQECTAVHLQDIAVRNVLKRLDRKFKGDHPVQIRGHKTEGYVLNPGQVPFHEPDKILSSGNNQKKWWRKDSVEEWYQSSKALLVNPDYFTVNLAILGPGLFFFEFDKHTYYSAEYNGKLPFVIKHVKGKKARSLYSKGDRTFIEIRNSPKMSYSAWHKKINELKLPYTGEQCRVEFGELENELRS